jgi:predicted PurR-regulated permease PerM
VREPTDRVEPASAKVVAAGRWLPRVAAGAGFPAILTVVGTLWALQWARAVVLPLLAAGFFALLLYPVVARLRRLRLSQTMAAVVAMLLVLGTFGVIVDATIGPAREWLDRAPRLLRDVDDRVRPLRLLLDKVERVTHQAERVTTGGAGRAVPVVKAAPESAARSVLLVTQAVVLNIAAVIVLTFFLLATRPASLARAAGALRGPTAARRVLVVIAALRVELGRYFGTVALINCGLGLATAAAMALLGVPNPALWGVLAAVLNFVPYVGPAVMLVILTVVALVTFDGLGSVLAVSATFLLLTTIEGQIVQPIAVGHRLAVSPLVVIIALLFWGWLWGVPGLILAVPLVLSIKAVCTHVSAWRPIAEAMSPAPRWTRQPRRRPPRSPPAVPPRSAGTSP